MASGVARKIDRARQRPDTNVMTSRTGPTKVIKRYSNRKLYDTERSCYVTLEEIAAMIKAGDDVHVIDNKTKDDLTAVTLAQIIVEEEKKVQKMPLKLLRSIIQSGNEAVSDFYEKRVVDPVKHLKEDVERRVESIVRREAKDPPKDQQKDAETSDIKESRDPKEVVQEFVTSTADAFETWQKRIDERVRDLLQRDKQGQSEKTVDLEALRRRVTELEDKIRVLETDHKPSVRVRREK
jgi:polyhydroxyalkanoate synthesis repressor PhaR